MTRWRYERFCYQCGVKVTRQTSIGRVVTRNKVTSCERLCHGCLDKERDATAEASVRAYFEGQP